MGNGQLQEVLAVNSVPNKIIIWTTFDIAVLSKLGCMPFSAS